MIKKGSFASNFLVLFSGNGLSQIIPLLFYPLITRLFSAEELAVRSNFIALASMIAIAAAGRYEMAIVLPNEKRKAMNLLSLSTRLILIVSILAIVFYFFRENIDAFYSKGEIGDYLIYLAPAVLLYAFTNLLTQWLNREKKYNALTSSGVARSAFVNLMIVMFGYLSYGVFGLVIGTIIGLLVALVIMTIAAKDSFEPNLISAQGRKEVAKEFKDFPIINAPHAFVDLFFSQFILFAFITREFGLKELGLYAMMVGIVLASMKAVGGAVGQLYFKEASELHGQNKNVAPVFFRSIKLIAIFAIPISLVIYFFGPDLFAIFLSEKFRDSGVYAQIMILAFCINFIVSPVSATPIIYRKQSIAFVFSIFGYGSGVAAIMIGSYLKLNFEETLKIFALTQCIYYVSLFIWYYSLIKKKR